MTHAPTIRHDWQQERDLLEQAARKAGKLALSYFNRDPQVWSKDNDSPVSEADLAVDKMLHEQLLGAKPDYGWLSEETEDNPARQQKDCVFVVDPIDGTRAFINGEDVWTISIAIVKDNRPVAAALYAPVRDELYLASKQGGTFLNGKSLKIPHKQSLQQCVTVGPPQAIKKGPLHEEGVTWGGYIGSLAYRIAMLADHKADLALARDGSHDWDLAAAELILTEAGGLLREGQGQTLTYNKAMPKHGVLYACCPELESLIQPIMPNLHFPPRKAAAPLS
ncbi:MAG: 3'(2'),5'-bisphosphate nucleotidase CysQ [Cohaesibacter sp.]|nr:3'(2'),5'-bisphosphate nucleotidase CysQ [Cohaesibacter sp.]MCV6600573.1 3'(2'),5'-bisphosphate nucleotidase CysQ [Cohaesibacter sp.]